MAWFNNMSVGRELPLTFSAVVLLVVVLGGFALKSLSDLHGAARELSGNWLPSGRRGEGACNTRSPVLWTNQLSVLMAKEGDREEIRQTLRKIEQAVTDGLKSYEAFVTSPEEQGGAEAPERALRHLPGVGQGSGHAGQQSRGVPAKASSRAETSFVSCSRTPNNW